MISKILWGVGVWSSSSAMPLLSLNHVSFVCESVSWSVRFYEEVLGFVLIKRPSSFKFQGAWYDFILHSGAFFISCWSFSLLCFAAFIFHAFSTISRWQFSCAELRKRMWVLFRLFNYGIGIHLLQCNSPDGVPDDKRVINQKDNHISFQCSDMQLLMRELEEMNIEYVTAVVEEGGSALLPWSRWIYGRDLQLPESPYFSTIFMSSQEAPFFYQRGTHISSLWGVFPCFISLSHSVNSTAVIHIYLGWNNSLSMFWVALNLKHLKHLVNSVDPSTPYANIIIGRTRFLTLFMFLCHLNNKFESCLQLKFISNA